MFPGRPEVDGQSQVGTGKEEECRSEPVGSDIFKTDEILYVEPRLEVHKEDSEANGEEVEEDEPQVEVAVFESSAGEQQGKDYDKGKGDDADGEVIEGRHAGRLVLGLFK